MQARGNYGDGRSDVPSMDSLKRTGFWSNGQRLKDTVKMGVRGLGEDDACGLGVTLMTAGSPDFPEYVCGVSAS
jgi:hypothetical protein